MTQSARRINIRSVALPSEHGGWGFILEPALSGLLLAPAWPTVLLTMAAFGVFLVHQPFKLAAKDYIKGRPVPRTRLALYLSILYSLLALVPALYLINAYPHDFLKPLLLAAPFALIQLYYDVRNQSRNLWAELSGAIALGALAAAAVMLYGWPLPQALILWLLHALRAVPSILYVRARLQLERDKPSHAMPVWVSHGSSLIISLALVGLNLAPWPIIIVFTILLARAIRGLSTYRTPLPASRIGMLEMLYGFITVAGIVLGYRLVTPL